MTQAEITRIVGWVLWCMTGAYAVLAFRLWSTGLFRRYRFFFGFVLFRVVRAIALSAVPIYSPLYAGIWFFTQPVLWVLYLLVVFELFGLVLEGYKGLATAGRWAMTTGLGLAVAIASFSLGPDLSSSSKYPMLRYWTVIDRGVESSVVLFLLFITAFLAWYPIKLSRNVVVHSAVYAVYFLSGASGMLVVNVWRESPLIREIANLGLSSATLLCLIAWIFFLKPTGENVTVAKRPQWSAEDEAHLIAQLSSINASLLRATRK